MFSSQLKTKDVLWNLHFLIASSIRDRWDRLEQIASHPALNKCLVWGVAPLVNSVKHLNDVYAHVLHVESNYGLCQRFLNIWYWTCASYWMWYTFLLYILYSHSLSFIWFFCKFCLRNVNDLNLHFSKTGRAPQNSMDQVSASTWKKTRQRRGGWKLSRWWQLKYLFIFNPNLGKISNLTSIFSNGLVQPPTSDSGLGEAFFFQ